MPPVMMPSHSREPRPAIRPSAKKPGAVMERSPAPRIVIDPRPAVVIFPAPLAVAVRRPRRRNIRRPYRAIVRVLLPAPVLIEVFHAIDVLADVLRRLGAQQ